MWLANKRPALHKTKGHGFLSFISNENNQHVTYSNKKRGESAATLLSTSLTLPVDLIKSFLFCYNSYNLAGVEEIRTSS